MRQWLGTTRRTRSITLEEQFTRMRTGSRAPQAPARSAIACRKLQDYGRVFAVLVRNRTVALLIL